MLKNTSNYFWGFFMTTFWRKSYLLDFSRL